MEQTRKETIEDIADLVWEIRNTTNTPEFGAEYHQLKAYSLMNYTIPKLLMQDRTGQLARKQCLQAAAHLIVAADKHLMKRGLVP